MLSEGSTWIKAAAIGGHAAAPLIVAGLGSDRESAKSGAAQACTKMMFDAKAVEALGALLDDKDAKVRQHALAALTFQGKWSYVGAQEALCTFAKDPKRSAGERKAAVGGLSEIVKLDLLGGFQLHRVLWTLLDLLDADEGGVRQMAFLALKGVDATGFGYSAALEKDKRAASLEKWTAWGKRVLGDHP
jgi:HEAT repeat protein